MWLRVGKKGCVFDPRAYLSCLPLDTHQFYKLIRHYVKYPHGNPDHAYLFKYIMALWFEDEAEKRSHVDVMMIREDDKENDFSTNGEETD